MYLKNGRVDSLGMKGMWVGYDVGCTMGWTLGHSAWQIDRPSNGSMWNSYSFQSVSPWMDYSFTDLGAVEEGQSWHPFIDLLKHTVVWGGWDEFFDTLQVACSLAWWIMTVSSGLLFYLCLEFVRLLTIYTHDFIPAGRDADRLPVQWRLLVGIRCITGLAGHQHCGEHSGTGETWPHGLVTNSRSHTGHQNTFEHLPGSIWTA